MRTDGTTSRIDAPVLERDDEQRRRVINRLKRLEGQVRGLQHMIEQGRSCREILTLLAGIRSALNATGDVILEHYVEGCLTEPRDTDEVLADLVQAVRLARG
jgi:CsoR family transcriptional regulator, copper-sensing transcriptional repressor